MGFVTLVLRCFDLASLCCLFVWGFSFFGPLFTIYICLYPVYSPNQVFLVYMVYVWAFSNASLFASFSLISFSVCNLLAFSSARLLASFSFISFSVCIFWPFLVLVFWLLSLLIAFQFLSLFFYHVIPLSSLVL